MGTDPTLDEEAVMSALVMAPGPRQYGLFPLVVAWQPWLASLSFYLPNLHVGLMTGAPPGNPVHSCLSEPRKQVWQTFAKHFQPGELSQWQAYLQYLAAQEDQDEQDLQAAIRGTLAPVLPPQLDGEALWSLAYQLEETLAEKNRVLAQVAAQERALERILGETDEAERHDLPLDVTFSPLLAGGVPDLPLARLRLHFWQKILAPHLSAPWTMVVLEPYAGESSPRFLWEAARDEGQDLWQAQFLLPPWQDQPPQEAAALAALELGVLFQKTLAGLLEAVAAAPDTADRWQEELAALATQRLWPAAAGCREGGVRLEIIAWAAGAGKPEAIPGPMVFLAPAD